MSTTSRAPHPDGLRYEEHWQPVLAAAARRLLERVAALVDDPSVGEGGVWSRPGGPVILDVGAGAGNLTLAAGRRWPSAQLIGLDASAAMLSVARHRAGELGADAGRRFRWLTADAASLPLDDGSVDVAISAFMLQLVPDRRAVLGEVNRVLRPGGILGFVTWVAQEEEREADVEFDEAVYELELDEPEADEREPEPGDYESAAVAAEELRALGFTDVDVRDDRLSFTWTRERYARFKEEHDEHELFESLSEADRARLRARVEERYAALPDRAFTLDAPLVSAVARRPSP